MRKQADVAGGRQRGEVTADNGAASAGSPGGVPKDFMQKLLSYAECMRAHGISDFPDLHGRPGAAKEAGSA